MRVVVQRASSGSVEVAGEVVGSLPGPGLVVLVGVTHTDTAADADRLADKVWQLRILDGERSASDAGAPVLVISQFTLHASTKKGNRPSYTDTRKGRRPSWSAAAPRPASEPLVEAFVAALRHRGAHVETGVFGALMRVALVNDGPVTLILDS